jgi:hypothetical protein
MLDGWALTRCVFETDVSRVDSSQGGWCSLLELLVLCCVCEDPDVRALWTAVVNADMVTKFRQFTVAGRYCKQSGEKSTSWGNTLITHLFLALVAALHATDLDVPATIKLLTTTQFTELFRIISGEDTPQCEGDDNRTPSNFDLTPAIELASSLLGFKIKLDVTKSIDGGSTFCKFKVTVHDDSVDASKEFSSSFYKHGLTKHVGLVRGSVREAALIQGKLLALCTLYDLEGLRLYAEACLHHLPKNRIYVNFRTCRVIAGWSTMAKALSDQEYALLPDGAIESRKGACFSVNMMGPQERAAFNLELSALAQIVKERGLQVVVPADGFRMLTRAFVNDDKQFLPRKEIGANLQMVMNTRVAGRL